MSAGMSRGPYFSVDEGQSGCVVGLWPYQRRTCSKKAGSPVSVSLPTLIVNSEAALESVPTPGPANNPALIVASTLANSGDVNIAGGTSSGRSKPASATPARY